MDFELKNGLDLAARVLNIILLFLYDYLVLISINDYRKC